MKNHKMPIGGLLIVPFLLVTLHLSTNPLAAQKRAIVELEVIAINAGLGTHQKWGEMLATVGADRFAIKSNRKRARTDVEETTYGNRKHYLVIGVLSRDRLTLPGGKTFTSRDKAKIAAYLQQIRDDGPTVALSEKMAFGMTAQQLVALQQDLAQLHNKSTKGARVFDVVESIAATIKTQIRVDSSAREALSGKDTIREELKTLSSGTTLAAILRPLGLVAMPSRQQGKAAQIVIIDTRKAEEHWPVGWPNERGNALVVPQMFESKDYKIENYPLMGDGKRKGLLEVIEAKVAVPFIYDHNSLARHGADLQKLKATVVKNKQTYFSVVRQSLSQVRPQMKMEIRLDEAGNPFVWVTTFKK